MVSWLGFHPALFLVGKVATSPSRTKIQLLIFRITGYLEVLYIMLPLKSQRLLGSQQALEVGYLDAILTYRQSVLVKVQP